MDLGWWRREGGSSTDTGYLDRMKLIFFHLTGSLSLTNWFLPVQTRRTVAYLSSSVVIGMITALVSSSSHCALGFPVLLILILYKPFIQELFSISILSFLLLVTLVWPPCVCISSFQRQNSLRGEYEGTSFMNLANSFDFALLLKQRFSDFFFFLSFFF